MSIGMRGRHGKQVIIDGEVMELRSLFQISANSQGITLPKLWLQYVGNNGEIKGIGVLQDGDKLILRPYYGEDGQVNSEEAE